MASDKPSDATTKPTSTAAAATAVSDTYKEKDDRAKAAALGEDDEFEDFPVDDWPEEQTEAATQGSEDAKHLWEESWDDDDTNDDFSAQLREELKKVDAGKKR